MGQMQRSNAGPARFNNKKIKSNVVRFGIYPGNKRSYLPASMQSVLSKSNINKTINHANNVLKSAKKNLKIAQVKANNAIKMNNKAKGLVNKANTLMKNVTSVNNVKKANKLANNANLQNKQANAIRNNVIKKVVNET